MSWSRSKGRVAVTLDRAASLLVVVVACVLLLRWVRSDAANAASSGRPEPVVPSAPVSISGAWTRGNADARVDLIVFSDFECPACRQFVASVLPTLIRDYVDTGRMRLSFWHHPLRQHVHATAAAELAECAGRAQRFWEMHDLLFSASFLDEKGLADAATRLGLGGDDLKSCLATAGPAGVRAALDASKSFDIRGTPTVFLAKVDGDASVTVVERLTGVRSASDYAKAIDKLSRQMSGNGQQ